MADNSYIHSNDESLTDEDDSDASPGDRMPRAPYPPMAMNARSYHNHHHANVSHNDTASNTISGSSSMHSAFAGPRGVVVVNSNAPWMSINSKSTHVPGSAAGWEGAVAYSSSSAELDTNNNNRKLLRGGTLTTTTLKNPFIVSRARFCSWDVLATINCLDPVVSSSSVSARAAATGLSGSVVGGQTSSRKVGPLLLELHQVLFQPRLSQHSLFATSTVCQSRGNTGSNVTSTCLDVAPVSSSIAAATAAAGTTVLSPCVTGLSNGTVAIHNFTDSSSGGENCWIPSIEYYYHLNRNSNSNSRPATSVAWRPTFRQVAVGLTGAPPATSDRLLPGSAAATRSGGHHRLGEHSASNQGVNSSTNIATGYGDRDFCCFVWDVEYQSAGRTIGGSKASPKTPLYKLSNQTGVSSLAWLLEGGNTLAVGGQVRHLHLYDLRSSGPNAVPPLAIYAHNFSVSGIEVDPSRPWQFATFCQAVNEPVKLWDVRSMDKPIADIKVTASDDVAFSPANLNYLSTAVSSVKWSTLEPGLLDITLGDSIFEYDTLARPVHVNTIHTKSNILDFALYPFSEFRDRSTSEGVSNKRAVADLFRNRLFVVDSDHTLVDVARRPIAPLAISTRDGRLLHGLGRTLWMGATSVGPTAMERSESRQDEDISATMMRRARCTQETKYSMNVLSNIRVLVQEDFAANDPPLDGPSLTRSALLRLWTWIGRVEELCKEEESSSQDEEKKWSATTLVDAGTWKILQLDGAGNSEMQIYSDELACNVYDSPDRRYVSRRSGVGSVLWFEACVSPRQLYLVIVSSAALAVCGWAAKADLASLMAECEALGDYERSAALAVWHGDIGAAVEALQRGADFIRSHFLDGRTQRDPRQSLQYAETLELASLSVAGYRGNDQKSAQSAVWRRACSGVLDRSDLSGKSVSSTRTAHIRCALQFLLAVGLDDKHNGLLGDATLALSDRVAFACRFLERSSLKKFLEQSIEQCKDTGNVEGLTITGVDKHGVQILQSFVERHGDVQSATFVTSRVIFPPEWSDERRVCAEWLDIYRALLNTWQMWQSRAMFDVDRAELLRKIKSRQISSAVANTGNAIGNGPSRRGVSARRGGPRVPDPDIDAAVPSQLDPRCNYCDAPLGLRNQASAPNPWLQKVKPVLSCCPQCRKPLPRCAICMLSLGVLNPYLELTKERPRSGRGTPQLQPTDDSSSMGNLPFAEWFSWCIRCKHGGHAHHLVGWFSKHSICPVSGCDCRCQFDGMPTLTRPALLQAQNVTSEMAALDCAGDSGLKEK
jgi:WD repeat-containing protein mio